MQGNKTEDFGGGKGRKPNITFSLICSSLVLKGENGDAGLQILPTQVSEARRFQM